MQKRRRQVGDVSLQREVFVISEEQGFHETVVGILGDTYEVVAQSSTRGEKSLTTWLVGQIEGCCAAQGEYPSVVVIDRGLFESEGRCRFRALSTLRARFRSPRVYIALVSLSLRVDRLDARDAGAHFVLELPFDADQFVREYEAVVHADNEREQLRRRTKAKGMLSGVILGVFSTVLAPALGNYVSYWLQRVPTDWGSEWSATVIPIGVREDKLICNLQLTNTGFVPATNIRVTGLSDSEQFRFTGLCEGLEVCRVERGKPSNVSFEIMILGDAMVGDVESGAIAETLWIELTGPGCPDANPRRIFCNKMLPWLQLAAQANTQVEHPL